MTGQIHAGDHRRAFGTVGVIDHRDPSVALLHGPEVAGFKAEKVANQGFVDGVMGHYQGGFVVVEAAHDPLPGRQGAVPHLLEIFALGHLHGLRGPFPIGQQLGPVAGDFAFQAALPVAVANLPQTLGAHQGHVGMAGQDGLGSLAGTGHRAGISPLNRYWGQKLSRRLGLFQPPTVEGDVDLALEAPLAVPVCFAVAHQQEPGTGGAAGQGGVEVGGAVEGLDLDLQTAVGPSAQV